MEKIVKVVVEPRVVQVLVLPESSVIATPGSPGCAGSIEQPGPVSAPRARRITDAYQPADPARKPLAIA